MRGCKIYHVPRTTLYLMLNILNANTHTHTHQGGWVLQPPGTRMHCKPGALAAWSLGTSLPLSVKLWRRAPGRNHFPQKSFSFSFLSLNMSEWCAETSKVHVLNRRAHTHTHACLHRALHAWLRCPPANPPLCVLRSRAEATGCGASAGESSRPQRALLTLTPWMRLKYFYSVRQVPNDLPCSGSTLNGKIQSSVTKMFLKCKNTLCRDEATLWRTYLDTLNHRRYYIDNCRTNISSAKRSRVLVGAVRVMWGGDGRNTGGKWWHFLFCHKKKPKRIKRRRRRGRGWGRGGRGCTIAASPFFPEKCWWLLCNINKSYQTMCVARS